MIITPQLSYNDARSQLQITIIECKDLKKMDTFGKSDPFVKIYLMPGTHQEMKTKTIKKTLDPQFKEQFTFNVKISFCVKIFLPGELFCSDQPRRCHEEDNRPAGV